MRLKLANFEITDWLRIPLLTEVVITKLLGQKVGDSIDECVDHILCSFDMETLLIYVTDSE